MRLCATSYKHICSIISQWIFPTPFAWQTLGSLIVLHNRNRAINTNYGNIIMYTISNLQQCPQNVRQPLDQMNAIIHVLWYIMLYVCLNLNISHLGYVHVGLYLCSLRWAWFSVYQMRMAFTIVGPPVGHQFQRNATLTLEWIPMQMRPHPKTNCAWTIVDLCSPPGRSSGLALRWDCEHDSVL